MKSGSAPRKPATVAREKNKRYGSSDLNAVASYILVHPRYEPCGSMPFAAFTATFNRAQLTIFPYVLSTPSYPRSFADGNRFLVRRPSAMYQCARDDLTLRAKAANAPQLATNVDRTAHISPPTTGSQRALIHQNPSAKRLGRMAKDRFEAT